MFVIKNQVQFSKSSSTNIFILQRWMPVGEAGYVYHFPLQWGEVGYCYGYCCCYCLCFCYCLFIVMFTIFQCSSERSVHRILLSNVLQFRGEKIQERKKVQRKQKSSEKSWRRKTHLKLSDPPFRPFPGFEIEFKVKKNHLFQVAAPPPVPKKEIRSVWNLQYSDWISVSDNIW